jgi:hypothetical protein
VIMWFAVEWVPRKASMHMNELYASRIYLQYIMVVVKARMSSVWAGGRPVSCMPGGRAMESAGWWHRCHFHV